MTANAEPHSKVPNGDLRKVDRLELIDWSERYPHLSSREITFLQSSICLCGRGKGIGKPRCTACIPAQVRQ